MSKHFFFFAQSDKAGNIYQQVVMISKTKKS